MILDTYKIFFCSKPIVVKAQTLSTAIENAKRCAKNWYGYTDPITEIHKMDHKNQYVKIDYDGTSD